MTPIEQAKTLLREVERELHSLAHDPVPSKIQMQEHKVAKALAALSRIKAEGWVLVPKEPTEDMLNAGWLARSTASSVYENSIATYRAMLAAIPALPEEPRPERWHGKFQVGDKVRKQVGYRFDGVILAAYYDSTPHCEGSERYVVQHADGWQHIFNASQLAPTAPPEEPR